MRLVHLLGVVVAVAGLLVACGGDGTSETATEIHTDAAAPRSSAPQSSPMGRTDATTPTASPAGADDSAPSSQILAISCNLDNKQVLCTATGSTEGAWMYWWTNAEDITDSGEAQNGTSTFSFTISGARPSLSINFEECIGNECQTVTTALDTAHLMPSQASTTTASKASPLPTGASRIATPVVRKDSPGTPSTISPPTARTSPSTQQWVPGDGLNGRECVTSSNPRPTFTHEVVPLELIRHTAPPGSVFTGMLKQHMYFFVGSGMPVEEWSGYPRSVPMYAPIDSWLHSVHVYKVSVAGQEVLEYEFVLEATCEVWYRLGHLGPLSDRIEALGPFEVGSNPIKPALRVDGGELVSYWSGVNPGGNVDLGVFNTTVEQTLANQDRYSDGYHDQQLYEDCPLDYFPEDLRSKYYSMLAEENTAEPVSTETCRRSADQSVAGTISGSWYIPDRYSPILAVGTSLLGSARVSFAEPVLPGGAADLSVRPDQPTHIHPVQVTSDHCYQHANGDVSMYVNLKLVTPTELEAEYGSGTCTNRTPINTLRVER